jgi:hypothetical protein
VRSSPTHERRKNSKTAKSEGSERAKGRKKAGGADSLLGIQVIYNGKLIGEKEICSDFMG